MKNILAAIVVVMTVSETVFSQNVNWRSMREDQPNLVQLNVGYDYGATAQVGYHRYFTVFRPVVLGLDFSFPMGSDLFDDYKVRPGAQMEIFEVHGFSATLRIASVFRRYRTQLVKVASFGSDFAVLAGYYQPTWSVAGEFGFDKSITSQLKHSDVMRENFPAIKDGWYLPTGGNYYYGIQGGKTLGENFDLSLRLGATNAQINDENAVLPVYVQLGLGTRF